MSPSIKTHNQKDHDNCLHHFIEQPYVLPESLPDDLVAFPKRLEKTPIPKPRRPPAILKPPTPVKSTKSPKAVQKRRFRETLGCIPTNATPKRHDSVLQSPAAEVGKPSKPLLEEIRHKESLRLFTNALFRNMPMP
jgi:hypothetical protein